MRTEYELLKKKFPFLTLFKYSNEEYLGIISNCGALMSSAYVYNIIQSESLKKEFIKLGEIWWYESNRQIPIDLFLKQDMQKFDFCRKNFISKEFKIIEGPCVQLDSLRQKRVKKKRINLKKIKK